MHTDQSLNPPQVPHHPGVVSGGPSADRTKAFAAREQVEGLSFGKALSRLESGGRVARAGWNGRGQYIELQRPDANSKMSRPYLFIHTVDGQLVPWVASQSDLLSYDWCVVSERTVLQYGEGGNTLSVAADR